MAGVQMSEAFALVYKAWRMGILAPIVGALRAAVSGDHEAAKREIERGAIAAAAHQAIDRMK